MLKDNEKEMRDSAERKAVCVNRPDHKKTGLSEILSAFGVIGWSVVTPILAGVFLGKYIDNRWPTGYSFTLMLLFVGAVIGSYNAWQWLSKKMGDNNGNKHR